ncbi:MAG: LPXTG cell wall anchor domain-containing protein [Oscillospiraceae bacterium]|nr:LPXTG cell wall anchor domain-containing protein [Oscillospiraceae bacterium]
MKKILALIMALALVMGLAVTAFAADSYSITITPPNGIESATYKVYKVFNAVPGENNTISYTLVSGKTTAPAGFTVDAAGNVSYTGDATGDELTAADINAIKDYVTAADLVATVNVTNGDPVVVSLTDAGYYYIATTNGAVVGVDSTKPTAAVTDKNQVPTIEKEIYDINSDLTGGVTSASTSFGSYITFNLSITIPATTPAGTVIQVYDEMDGALDAQGTLAGKYTDLGFVGNAGWNGWEDTHLGTITVNANNVGKTIVLQYTADFLGEYAVVGDAGNKNAAWLISDGYTSEKSENTIYTYQVDVYKWTGTESNGLAGAGFKLKDQWGNYYTEGQGTVTWTSNGTELTTDAAEGYVISFVGIPSGTYTLEETTVPPGYNKAADEEIVITNANWVEDNRVEVENKTGSELPSTGGIGTTLFYVIGTLMMTGAAVLMITKKRMSV